MAVKEYKKALVSVLIPAYNHEKYITQTIDSIINQSYQNIELIIVDDGSSDNTFKIILDKEKECKNRFKKVVFKSRENKGTCETLNELISLASGEFIYLIASDDMADKKAIEKFAIFLTNNKDYVACVGDSAIIDGNSKRFAWGENQELVELNSGGYDSFWAFYYAKVGFLKNINYDDFVKYEYLVQSNYIPNGYLIRHECFNNFSFTKEAPLEDWYLHFQLVKLGKYQFFNEIMFFYRWHKTNTIKNTERMNCFSEQTIKYEWQKVQANEIYKKIFIDKLPIYKRLNLINIFVFKLFVKENIAKKIYFMSIFGIHVKLYQKIKTSIYKD